MIPLSSWQLKQLFLQIHGIDCHNQTFTHEKQSYKEQVLDTLLLKLEYGTWLNFQSQKNPLSS